MKIGLFRVAPDSRNFPLAKRNLSHQLWQETKIFNIYINITFRGKMTQTKV